MRINYYGFRAIYLHEMDRFRRTLLQSLISPVLSTSLYFIVFGSVIGNYVQNIDGISYGSYIVPGLIMLTLLSTFSDREPRIRILIFFIYKFNIVFKIYFFIHIFNST